MGLHENLDEAARCATKEMIAYPMQERGLSRDDASTLTSAGVDLQVTQAGNMACTPFAPSTTYTFWMRSSYGGDGIGDNLREIPNRSTLLPTGLAFYRWPPGRVI